jgi:hypothetical protein
MLHKDGIWYLFYIVSILVLFYVDHWTAAISM